MAQTMYRWYQQTGGEDEWQPIQASEPLDSIKPTFVTILACDTLIDKNTPREVLVKAKYQGPMYFDLDDKEDVSNSIGDAQKLYEKLLSHDLQEQDIQIFLSGKKGLHLIVPEACFMSKPMPQVGLVAMYKEMAFKLAVDTMDFRVYTAKRGRQFRTCYNVRENGNYKVQISAAELSSLTPETYQELCKEPRPMLPLNPQWRGKFALLYDQAYQKITKLKPKPVKPVQPAVLKEQLPLFERLASGKVKTVSGFNVIAMQLCLYAREAGWTEDQLIEQCQGLIENHQSDGSRYNTKWRRAAELRRMFWYLDDNPSFEYSVKGIRACMAKEAQAESEDEPDQDGEQTIDTNFGGVYRGVTAYMAAKGDDGDIPITNFVGKDVIVYRSAENGLITSIAPVINVQGKKGARLAIPPSIFTGGASLQNTVAAYGGAFSGTDVHARGIYQAMLKEVTTNCYVTTVEGLSVLKLGTGSKERTEHVVWADREGIRANDDFSALGGNLVFEGDPDPRGLFKTDLLAAPDLPTFLAEEGGAARLTGALQALFNAHTPESMGKIVGWAVAAYYAPLFQAVHHKFPLLHIYGPAGSGKCLALDTPVLMADGTTKLVQDVEVGDYLLSPYGAKQKVLSLARGRERMWKVTPVKGDSYTCNESHILSLKRSNKDGVRLNDGRYIPGDQDVLNISVKDYYENPKLHKQFKGWRLEAPVEFHRPEEVFPLDAYFLGAWLGDGRSTMAAISKPMCNMVKYCNDYAVSLGCTVTHHNSEKWNRCDEWSYARAEGRTNPISEALRQLGVLKDRTQVGSDNKRIPEAYKFGSVSTRKKLLAGLLDSDGHLGVGGYDFISKHKHVADDVAFIARSLGLAAYISETVKRIKSTGFEGTYYRVSISGDCTILPMLDKIPEQRKQVKRVTVTGITVEPLEEGDYYGFTLDGDHLFMLGDFTVTHNTELSRGILRLFYHRADPLETTPNSSVFALQHMAAGSASIPLLIDEYKPHVMNTDKLNALRALLRDLYNAKEVQRGGGNKSAKDNFNALSSLRMQAPVMFVAEAAETETAIVERSVMVSFKRLSGRQQAEAYRSALAYYRDTEPMASLGIEIANRIVAENNPRQSLVEFDKLLAWANNKFLPAPDDYEKVKQGLMTEDEMRLRSVMRPRNIFNATVAAFGLKVLKGILIQHLGEDTFAALFADKFNEMARSVFLGMDKLAVATLPEYVKTLVVMSDMSKLASGDPHQLVEGVDYNLSEYAERMVLVLAVSQAYRKYRIFVKAQGLPPLYPSEEAFRIALTDIPQFLKLGTKTQFLEATTVVLDVEELTKAGVPIYRGKAANLDL